MIALRAGLALALSAGLLLAVPPAHGEPSDSGLYVEIKESEAAGSRVVERWKLYGASHALVIGNDDYRNGWPRLSNAVRDARLVAAALEARGFEVELLTDLGGEALRERLRRFLALRGADPEARLFVWFAGHGYSEAGEGYLVPVDAPPPESPEFRVAALHLGDVGAMVRLARAKHVLAVFDSCFAGTVFSAQRSRPPAAITRAAVAPVRQFLTAGDADQQVSDDGTFRELFLRALAGEEGADVNGDGYLTGTELGLYLEDRVTNLTQAQQTPRSGKLRDPRFDRGDFIFLLPQRRAGPATGPAAALPAADPADSLFWSSIKDSEDPADYAAYLAQFANGTFAALARRRLAAPAQRQAAVRPETAGADPELARVLVGHAVAARRELAKLEGDAGLYWWYVLHRKGGEELLQRSLLLAVEALRLDRGEEAERALNDGLALLTCPRVRLKHGRRVAAIGFSPDGAQLASAGPGPEVLLWDAASGREFARLGHEGGALSLAFGPDGTRLASGGEDGTARVWLTASGREVARLAHDGPVTAVAFSPDGSLLATASRDSTARLWALDNGREVARLNHQGPVRAVEFGADGHYLATLAGLTSVPAESAAARVWRVPGGEPVAVLAHDSPVEALAVSPDGIRLATASGDGARIWALASGRELAHIAPGSGLAVIAFGPDGLRLAGGRRQLTLWDAASGRELAASVGEHGDNLRALAFSPDGRQLASAGQDATARVWDAETGRELARMAFPGAVDAIAFGPDGRSLATAGESAFVEIWDLRAGDPVAAACGCLTRDLTPEEWRRYLGEAPYRPTCAAASRE